jgi:hypothetical protein
LADEEIQRKNNDPKRQNCDQNGDRLGPFAKAAGLAKLPVFRQEVERDVMFHAISIPQKRAAPGM